MNNIVQISMVCFAIIVIGVMPTQQCEAQSLGSFGKAAKEKAKKIAERKAKERLDRAINSSQETEGSSSRRANDRNQRSNRSIEAVAAENPELMAKLDIIKKIDDFNTSSQDNFMDLINELNIEKTRELMNDNSRTAEQVSTKLRFYEKKFTDIGDGTGLMRYLVTDIDNDMNPNQKRANRKKNLNMLLDYTQGNLKLFPNNKNLKEFRNKALTLEKTFDSKFASREKAVAEILSKRNIRPRGSLKIAGSDQMLQKRAASRGKFLKGYVISNDWYYSKNSLGIILYKQAEAQIIIKKSTGDCELVTYSIRADKAGSNSYGKPYVHQAVGAFDILCNKAE